MKKLYFLWLYILFSHSVMGQSLGYDQHRIAMSADGNNEADNHPEAQWPRADPDDWGATPASLGIVAKLGLQDKLVHFSYNNFIESPAHKEDINQMKIGADGAIERWNFDASRFFDVTTQKEAAITHLANELKKSTAEDPLYFIHMGPSEFFYLAVEQVVNVGKEEALSHVHVISHSGYNDNHLRRKAHHTLTEVIELSGNRLKYKKIVDQNANYDPHQLWHSEKDFTVWHWIRDHSDVNIQWMYERMLHHPDGKADISDAGMVFYLLTGDEYGSPEKFKNFLGNGIIVGEIPVEGVELEEEANLYLGKNRKLYVTIIPSSASNKNVKWASSDTDILIVNNAGVMTGLKEGTAKVTATSEDGDFTAETLVTVQELPSCSGVNYVAVEDFEVSEVEGFVPAYKDESRNAIAVDASLYPDEFAATQKVFTGGTGYYQIILTTLTEVDGESTYRLKVNDRLVGSFENPETENDMEEYNHIFSNVLVEEGDIIQIESNAHSNGKIPEGEAYAYARGRWRAMSFDCLGECQIEEVDGLLIFEAERFPLEGDWKVGYDSEYASGGQYLYYAGNNSYQSVPEDQIISYTFKINNPGEYNVKWTMRQQKANVGVI